MCIRDSPFLHAQLHGNEVAQNAGLGVGKVAGTALVDLMPVGEEEQLGGVVGLALPADLVSRCV